jgi:adenosylhomocysteinase
LYGVAVEIDDPFGWAEVVIRRYARQTNRLIAGRPFAVSGSDARADALVSALTGMGALVRPVTEPVDATFDTTDAALAAHTPRPRLSAAERIDWAQAHMPVVAELAGRLADSGAVRGLRVGICLVLEPKTAVLALALAGAGAAVSVYGHPEETDAAVAAELGRRGITVFADPDPSRVEELVEQFLGQHLNLLVDDGSRLIRRLVDRPELAADLIGAAEETTSGLRALRELRLPFPVVAVNDARSKLCFDNAHGTGQSCLFTILDLLAPPERPWPVAGRTVVVAGFGPVGEGFARHASALGAAVLVADPDPVAELRARFAGYGTGRLVDLVARADLVVSAAGYPHTIDLDILNAARGGAAVAVAGGVDDEADWRAAVAAGAELRPVAPAVEDLVLSDGHSVRLLDRGGCINCTAGEGNPIEVMDLSFGVQLAALDLLTRTPLAAGVHPVPADADALVARLALDSWNPED